MLFAVNCIFPLLVVFLYCSKLKNANPKVDLDPLLESKELFEIYGTDDIDYIEKHVYKESDHQQFMEKYGALIEEIDI